VCPEKVLILVAILLYPKLMREICTVNEFQKVSVSHSSLTLAWQKKNFKDILAHPFFAEDNTMPLYSFLQLESEDDIKGLNKIFDIYVERTKIAWKNNNVILWVKAAIGFVLTKIDEK